jgi:hypothetical protein
MRPSLRLALALATLLAVRPATAQQPSDGPGALSGSVVSQATGQPIPAAAVSIRRMADSTLVAGTIANAAGRFVREGLPIGVYRVEITSVGHVPFSRTNVEITAASPRQDLGAISIGIIPVEVQGLTVEGQRSVVSVATDRSIYRVSEMPMVQGGVATDALRAIPELEVDVDDNITARGGTPQIFLDGRPLPMQGAARIAFLRSLRADRIDRIEYIPNPSARYEADGQSGIVNIVLRSDVSLGLSGSVAANAGTRGSQSLSNRLNYQRGRLTFFGGGLLGFNQSKSSTFNLRENFVATPINFLQQDVDRRRNGINGGVDLTTELKLTPKSTMWTIVRGNLGGSDESSLAEFAHLDADRDPIERYDRENAEDNGNDNYSGALGFRRVVEAQRDEFSAELRYNSSGNDADSENLRFPRNLDGERLDVDPDLTRIGSDTDDGVWSLQADLSKPLASATRLDIGFRGSVRTHRARQDVDLFTPGDPSADVNAADRYRYTEDAQAAYFTLDQRLGPLGVQAGLRAERVDGVVRSDLLSEDVSFRHDGLFPSANLAYDFGSGRQLRVSYSRRLQRPSANNYSPINTTPADPFNRSVGNPRLTPAYINSFSVDGSWTGALGTFRVSPFLGQGSGFWTGLRTVDEDGVSTMKPDNIASARITGLSLNGSVRQRGPFSGFVALNMQHIDFDSGLSNLDSGTLNMWFTSANVTAALSPTLRLQLTGNFSPAQAVPQGRSGGFRQANFALTQRIWGDRGVVTLSVVDPFDLANNTSTTQDASHLQTARTNNRIRRANLSFSYNFGRPPQAARRVIQDEPTGGGGLGGQ